MESKEEKKIVQLGASWKNVIIKIASRCIVWTGRVAGTMRRGKHV
jgi:hypothetical protein